MCEVAQGGVDGPATAHAAANMHLGATRDCSIRTLIYVNAA